LDCLRALGTMVNFGNASGPVTQINTADLVSRGSLFCTRPTLFNYTAKRGYLDATATELIDVVGKGKVNIEVN
ncbi:quinone oxidoreductase, partial [Pandoraea pneumonica]